MPIRGDLQCDPLEAHTVIMAHRALILLTEDVIQGAPDPWHKGGAFLPRRLPELGVEGRQRVFGQIPVGHL
jgi:hypothetical protein